VAPIAEKPGNGIHILGEAVNVVEKLRTRITVEFMADFETALSLPIHKVHESELGNQPTIGPPHTGFHESHVDAARCGQLVLKRILNELQTPHSLEKS
jgi:hypothetical protein